MSEEAIYVYKIDKVKETDLDNLVKRKLNQSLLYTEEFTRAIPDYIKILKNPGYLKFKTTENKYDPVSDSTKGKEFYYYVVKTNLDGQKDIRSDSDIPDLIKHIIEFYKLKINNAFKGQTAFEDVYRDYKNKHPKEDMLDYSSAKRDFFEKESMYGKQQDPKKHPENVYTPYQLFLDTLVLYLIYKFNERSKQQYLFKKLKTKKNKKIPKLFYKIKSKFIPSSHSDKKHEDIIAEKYKEYEDLFDEMFKNNQTLLKKNIGNLSKKTLPSDAISIINNYIIKKKYNDIIKTVIIYMAFYGDCTDNTKFVLYLFALFYIFNNYFNEKTIEFQPLILFDVITTKILFILINSYLECPLNSKILRELQNKQESIKSQVEKYLKIESEILEEPIVFEKKILKEEKPKEKPKEETPIEKTKLDLFLKNYSLYKDGNPSYDDLSILFVNKSNLEKIKGFLSEIERYPLEDMFEIIKILFKLIFNSKEPYAQDKFSRIFQNFLDELKAKIPNFDKIMIKDKDKNPFFLMYFLSTQGIYIELHCNSKTYKIQKEGKYEQNPYKIYVDEECYNTNLILTKLGISVDNLVGTTNTPRDMDITPGDRGNLFINSSSSSLTGTAAVPISQNPVSRTCTLPTLKSTTEEKKEEDLDIFSQCNESVDKSKLSNLEAVLYHQCCRFKELDMILSQSPQTTVVIAGDSKTGHSLGKGIAVDAWGGKDNQDYKKMQDNLTKYINYLVTKYGKVITFGNVGQMSENKDPKFNVTSDPEASYINVWGADVDNWNLDKGMVIEGGGQASSFERQAPGVFGICTMPVNSKTKEKVLEDSKYTKRSPGSTQILSPTPPINRKGNQTPTIHQQASSPKRPSRRPSRRLPGSQQASSLLRSNSSGEWDTSDEAKSSSDEAKSSSDEAKSSSSDESESDYDSESGDESVSGNESELYEKVVSSPKIEYYVYFGSLDYKTAYKEGIITVMPKDYYLKSTTLNKDEEDKLKNELKKYIKSELQKSQSKILIRLFFKDILQKFIYLTTEKNEKLPDSMLVTSAEKDPILQSVFELVQSKFKSKKKSLAKKSVSKKKSLAKKQVSKKKSLVKKSVSKKKSLVKKSVSKKKSLAKKSVSKKKSLAKKPVKSLYKKKKF